MKNARTSSGLIKSKFLPFVKILLTLALTSAFLPGLAHAQDDEGSDDFLEADAQEPLPKIQARTYNVKVLRRSKSYQVYLFEDSRSIKPRIGKIVLLRDNQDHNAMAFRVIKVYFQEQRFAAVQVRKYDNYPFLEVGNSFTAIEKIADIAPLPTRNLPPETKNDLKELEDQDDLDSEDDDDFFEEQKKPEAPQTQPEEPSTKLNKSSKDSDDEEFDDDFGDEEDQFGDEEEEEEIDDLLEGEEDQLDYSQFEDDLTLEDFVILDSPNLDQQTWWFSLSFAYIKIPGPVQGLPSAVESNTVSRYVPGGGIQLGVSLAKRVFLTETTQDSLALEVSAYFSSVSDYTETSDTPNLDSYTLMPLQGIARYNIHFNDTFILFFYGGALFDIVIASENGIQDQIDEFSKKFTIAAGGGFFVQLGPQWMVRLQGGMDSFSTGVVLRF